METKRNDVTMEIIHIYHTNDLHSHFEHWPRIHSFLNDRKQWHQDVGDEVYLFDIGDHVDRFHPYSDGTMGKGNIELLNQVGYTAVTIGNNEGITFPHEALDSMYDQATYPILVANLYNQDGTRPDWVKPFQILTTNSGTRVGIIGLTVFYEHLYGLLGWKLKEPFQELRKQIDQLKGKTDVLILLSHLGLHEDEAIARDFPEIDIILGGHTHHLLHQGKIINNSLLCAAGKYGQFVGNVTLELEKGKIIKRDAILYDTNELPPVEAEQENVKKYHHKGKQLLEKKVVHLSEGIMTSPIQDSPLPALLCEALHEWCDADCAFINSGLLLDGLKKGPVTRFDLLEICPHPINPCLVELTGRELKEVLLQTQEQHWPHLQVTGLGFRGKVMGVFTYSGITINRKQDKIEVLIGKKQIVPEKIYKLAIPDMFTFGRYFPEIFRAESKTYYLPEFLRDILEWKLSENNSK